MSVNLEERELLFKVWEAEWGMSEPFPLGGFPEWTRCLIAEEPPEGTGMTRKAKPEYFMDTKTDWEIFGKKLQDTGLKDSKGERIFEGYIIAYGGINYIVQYEGCSGSFIGKVNGSSHHISGHALRRGKIIGNIFDNPDLLG